RRGGCRRGLRARRAGGADPDVDDQPHRPRGSGPDRTGGAGADPEVKGGIWAVVPIKDTTAAKQRLADAAPAKIRQALALAMAEDVLSALAEARDLAGIVVVTVDPTASALAGRYGARVKTEGALDGHTGAVIAAARVL